MRTSLFLKKISSAFHRKARTSFYAAAAGRLSSRVEFAGSTGVDPFMHTVRGLLMRGGYVLTDGPGKDGRLLVDATFCMPVNYSRGTQRMMFLSVREFLRKRKAYRSRKASGQEGDYFLPPHIWMDNYYHFLVEGLPAVHWALFQTDLTIVLPEIKPSYSRLLDHFGWDWRSRVKTFERDGELFGAFSGLTNIRVVRKGSHTLPNPVLLDFYRRHASHADRAGGVLVVSRRLTGDRRILNEDELVDRLSVHFACEVLVPESDDLDTQMRKIRSASVMVGSHGAGLTNLLFNRGLKCLVEVLSSEGLVNNSFLSLCEAMDIEHRFLVSEADKGKPSSGLDLLLPANRRSFTLTEGDMTGIIEAVRAHLPA